MRCRTCEREVPLAAGDRVGFRDTCDGCGADLHTCRQCRHHDVSAYNECRESSAERVADRDRANRCEWFAPGDGGGAGEGREGALSDLEALFKK